MNNRTKSQRKGYLSHTGRGSDEKNAVAIVKIVPQKGCVSPDSVALVSQRGKQFRGNPMQKVLGSIRKVRFTQSTLRQASIRDKKGPSLGKIQVKPRHQRSPYAKKIRGSVPRRLKDKSDEPKARLGISPKTFTSSKRTTKLHSTRPRKNGYSRLRQQKSQRKESLWWIFGGSSMWSASETLTMLSWRPWGHRGVLRRWRPKARCEQIKKRRYTSNNGTYSWR